MMYYLMPSSLNLHKGDNIWNVLKHPVSQTVQPKYEEWHYTNAQKSEVPILSVIWMWVALWKKDVSTAERQNWAWCVHHHNAPARGTNGRIKCAPTLCCKPNHFSWATIAPSGKRKKKKKFFLTRNWFISHYNHFKRTGCGWFQRSLTEPCTFKEPEFWGGGGDSHPTNSDRMCTFCSSTV